MKILLTIFILINVSCKQPTNEEVYMQPIKDTTQTTAAKVTNAGEKQKVEIQTGNTTPQELLAFAETIMGTPYKYGSIDPSQGFDCSGFITYVFGHFSIAVPRSSIGFTNAEREIDLTKAKPGDIILFTGTDSTIREAGHMGIITSAEDKNYQFIHSSSGKANGVTITPLNPYYMGRFIKVIRVFKQNDIN